MVAVLLLTGQRKKARASFAALWQRCQSATSPFSLHWDTEVQAVPLGQRFQTVLPKSDALASTEMSTKKGKGRLQSQFRNTQTVRSTVMCYKFKKSMNTTRSDTFERHQIFCHFFFFLNNHSLKLSLKPIHRLSLDSTSPKLHTFPFSLHYFSIPNASNSIFKNFHCSKCLHSTTWLEYLGLGENIHISSSMTLKLEVTHSNHTAVARGQDAATVEMPPSQHFLSLHPSIDRLHY